MIEINIVSDSAAFIARALTFCKGTRQSEFGIRHFAALSFLFDEADLRTRVASKRRSSVEILNCRRNRKSVRRIVVATIERTLEKRNDDYSRRLTSRRTIALVRRNSLVDISSTGTVRVSP